LAWRAVSSNSNCKLQSYQHVDIFVIPETATTTTTTTEMKGSMHIPGNFHFYCFEKDTVKGFNRATVNKVNKVLTQ